MMSGENLEKNYIGFANIADQFHRKSVKRGFEFTLMVVGESGLGKSTLINSLFLTNLYTDRKIPCLEERIKRTTEIHKRTMEIEEKGVKLRLTIVDTPGFGDGLQNSDSWKTCVKYVDDQFAHYFECESGLHRKSIVDTRVHCCLYFIPPYVRGFRQIDLEFLKRLHYKVNLIPIISKADTLTKQELAQLKQRINHEIEENDIEIYQFPDCDSDEDDEFKSQDMLLKCSIPFAIVSGTQSFEVHGQRVRGRQYPWGIVEVDNPEHSDFSLLRRFLIQTHMQDLKDVTHDVHYENYRVKRLSDLAQLQQGGRLQLASLAAASASTDSSISSPGERSKLKRDSYIGKSREELDDDTEKLLMEKDAEIKKMEAMLQQMQAKLNNLSK